MSKDRYSDSHTIEILQDNDFLVSAAQDSSIRIYYDGATEYIEADSAGNIIIDAGETMSGVGNLNLYSAGATNISSESQLYLTGALLTKLIGEGVEIDGTAGYVTISSVGGDISLNLDSSDANKVLVDGKMKILTETGGQIPLTVRHDVPTADQLMFRIKDSDAVVFSVDAEGDVVCGDIDCGALSADSISGGGTLSNVIDSPSVTSNFIKINLESEGDAEQRGVVRYVDNNGDLIGKMVDRSMSVGAAVSGTVNGSGEYCGLVAYDLAATGREVVTTNGSLISGDPPTPIVWDLRDAFTSSSILGIGSDGSHPIGKTIIDTIKVKMIIYGDYDTWGVAALNIVSEMKFQKFHEASFGNIAAHYTLSSISPATASAGDVTWDELWTTKMGTEVNEYWSSQIWIDLGLNGISEDDRTLEWGEKTQFKLKLNSTALGGILGIVVTARVFGLHP